MPNHITNRLTVIADNDRVREILEAVKDDEHGLGSLDFEKIIPPPPDIYRGDVGAAEQQKYGNNTLLDFAREKWGTKWNSYGYGEYPPYSDGSEIRFNTAWDRPEPVIVKLSQMFPDAQFQHQWADEDIGNNVGEILYEDGQEIAYDVPTPYSKEAYEMASSAWELDLSEWGLYYSEELGNYHHVPDEELFAEHQRQMAQEAAPPQGTFSTREHIDWDQVYISHDFQCDQTEGWPTMLCWDMAEGKAWLDLNYSLAEENQDMSGYEKLCRDFGMQDCLDWDEFNSILEELGEDAVRSAWVSDDDESEEFGGIQLS
jgi:hypothetical protein